MNVKITITDDGLDVTETDEEAIGCYRGSFPPDYLPGGVNVFVGKNFTDAKRGAVAYIEPTLDELRWTVEDLKALRKKDVR